VPILKYTKGCYEVQDVQFGKVYRWCPESLLVECDCGQRASFTSSKTTCQWCGSNYATIITDYAALAREEPDTWQLEEEAMHPWRYAKGRQDVGIPC
jgi:hypothetical protein